MVTTATSLAWSPASAQIIRNDTPRFEAQHSGLKKICSHTVSSRRGGDIASRIITCSQAHHTFLTPVTINKAFINTDAIDGRDVHLYQWIGAEEVQSDRENPGYVLKMSDGSASRVPLHGPISHSYVPVAFNTPTPSDDMGASQGRLVEYNNTVLAHTNDADGDTAEFLPPGSTLPAACNGSPAQTKDNEAVVDRGDLPQATGPGIPTTSFGAVHFRATVN